MIVVTPSTLVTDQFPVFEDDGYSKRTGLSAGDFTVTVYKDGVVDTLSTAIIEIGTSGEYKLEYTPVDEARWRVQVLIDFNKDIWVSEVLVTSDSITDIKAQVDKIDLAPTLGPAAVTSGSLMDRSMNKDVGKTFNQGTDSLEAISDRAG